MYVYNRNKIIINKTTIGKQKEQKEWVTMRIHFSVEFKIYSYD